MKIFQQNKIYLVQSQNAFLYPSSQQADTATSIQEEKKIMTITIYYKINQPGLNGVSDTVKTDDLTTET